ncbi:MAG: cellulose synthase, partial [Erwinia sp.]
PDERHETDEIEAIDLMLQSGAISIPVSIMGSNDGVIRLKFDEIPLSRRRELVRVVLSRADAWIKPEGEKDKPFRSLITIVRTVFELFWLTWKDRRAKRQVVKEEDGVA